MYGHMQGRPTYFIAYDSKTADTGAHGPTDTPLPAQPSEAHIRTTSEEPDTDAVDTMPDTASDTVHDTASDTVTVLDPEPRTEPERTQARG